jgi:hypothetical protein
LLPSNLEASVKKNEGVRTQSDDNSPHGQTMPAKKNICSKQNKVQRQITLQNIPLLRRDWSVHVFL